MKYTCLFISAKKTLKEYREEMFAYKRYGKKNRKRAKEKMRLFCASPHTSEFLIILPIQINF